MAKKKSKLEPSSISAVSSAEAYEATYFARRCGLTRDEALKIMREAHGRVSMSTTMPFGAKRKN